MKSPAIYGCDGPNLGPSEAAFFREADPFGFIVFDRNLQEPGQIRRLCADLRDCVGREVPILIDQEGGRVQRLRPPLATEWLPPLDEATQSGLQAAEVFYLRYRIIAHELRSLGIDCNCAPTADLITGGTHPFLKNRCYSDDVDLVIALSRAVADGLLAGGVLPVIKHMPGHGRAVVDSHHHLPRTTASVEDLESTDFVPFRALADLPMAMSAHVVYSALDHAPATTSEPVISYLREALGFSGLIMTDDIGMNALPGTVPERSAAAISAGCDLVLCCNSDLAERVAVAEVIGSAPEATTMRADAAIARRLTPGAIDISELRAQLNDLRSGHR